MKKRFLLCATIKLTTFVLLVLLQSQPIFSQNSVIVLYGCSSAGKTSISNELLKTLPGKWIYVASNKFAYPNSPQGNRALWSNVNSKVSAGYSVIVDTHNDNILLKDKENTNLLVVLLHCSLDKLIEHVNKRNTNVDSNTHRSLKRVFKEFCNKYKTVSNNEKHIDSFSIEDLRKQYSLTTYFALKKIKHNFFKEGQTSVRITPCITNYDCIVNTGKLSIIECAKKIKRELGSVNQF